MSDYVKGALSIPSLILIVGAVGLIAILFVCLMTLFNTPTFIGPAKLFSKKGLIEDRRYSNRVSSAVNILWANSSRRIFWFGGFGLYTVRVPRDGAWAPISNEKRELNRELDREVGAAYDRYLDKWKEASTE